MSRWGNRMNEEQQKIDFNTILNGKQNAIELLQIKNFVEEFKYKSSKFTQKLVEEKHRQILYSFIDIALNPIAFMKNNNLVVDKTLTYGAIEVLSNLSQEFIQEVFDSHHDKEDEVVQTELEYPILIYIFKVLDEEEVQQTGLAYLNKLITPFIYQRPQQMIKFINSSMIQHLYKHYWNRSVGQLFSKLLEAQTQKNFFQQQKIKIVQKLCLLLKQQKQQAKFQINIQNFYELLQFIQQKHEDKYDKGKYASLIKKIVENFNSFQFLIAKLQEYNNNKEIKINILKCLQAYLHIHQVKIVSKLSDENEIKNETFKLQEGFINKLVKYLQSHSLHQYCSDLKLQILYYYRIIKTFLNIEPTSIINIINKKFIQDTLKIMEQNPNNNILHNYQRQVIVKAISQSQNIGQLLVKELSFFTRISSNISEKNSQSCLQNQLFLIGQALKAKQFNYQNGTWDDLYNKLKKKRQFYSVQIGGNPRNQEDKWDKFQGQMILPEQNEKPTQQKQIKKEEIVQKIQMVQISTGLDELGGTQVLSEQQQDPFNNNNKLQQVSNHFFDLQLPLDSDQQKKQDNPIEEQKKVLDTNPIVIVQQKEQKVAMKEEMVELDKVDTVFHRNSFQSSSSSFDYMSINKNIISRQQDSQLVQPISSKQQSTVTIHLDNFNIVDFKIKNSSENLGLSSTQINDFQLIDRSNSIVNDQNIQRQIQLLRQSCKEQQNLSVSKNYEEQSLNMVSQTTEEIKDQPKQLKSSQMSSQNQSISQLKIPTLQYANFSSMSQSYNIKYTNDSRQHVAHKDELYYILISKYGTTLTNNMK